MEIVDPHVHFFNHQQGNYHWLASHNPPYWDDKAQLRQPALPHLLPCHGPVRVAGFVHIEAGFDNDRPWREIHWLTQVCSRPFKAVACIDLTGSHFSMHLDALRGLSAVAGVRHILDEHAADILRQPIVRHRFARLADAGLSFEAQMRVSDRQAVSRLVAIAEANPHLRIIINHAGFPPEAGQAWQRWLAGLKALAACPNVAIKLSGWEMANRHWQWAQMHKVADAVLNVFAATSVMLASNYPLCRWTLPYRALWQGYARHLPQPWHRPLLQDNARRWYKLPTA